MKHRVISGIVLLAALGGFLYWRLHRRTPPISTAYAGESKLTLWSSTAEVREPVETVSFGQPLSVVEKSGENLKVRFANGREETEGWVAAKELIDAKLWAQEQDLTKQAEGLEVQAAGHTKAVANLRTEAGRDSPRFYQLDHDVQLAVLKRQVLDVPSNSSPAATQTAAREGEPRGSAKEPDSHAVLADSESTANVPTRKEGWLLVLASTKGTGSLKHVSGWVLSKFVEMDLPTDLTAYATAAGMRPVSWGVLNRVIDPAGPKPQYVVFGTKGPEGNPCDFTTFRVFTWDLKRQRYETAFIESNFCGQLPVHYEPAIKPGGDANFHFNAIDENGKVNRRHYHLHQTKVHRMGTDVSKETKAKG
jgi:hypothetical protein